jgi:hypothetical protein
MSSVSLEGFGRCSLSFMDELGTGDKIIGLPGKFQSVLLSLIENRE